MMARIDQVLAGDKSWGQYALDVLGHAGLGTLYALPTTCAGVYLDWPLVFVVWIGIALALTGGVIRELIQLGVSGKPHPLDRTLDALHHILGAPIAFGIVLGVRALL